MLVCSLKDRFALSDFCGLERFAITILKISALANCKHASARTGTPAKMNPNLPGAIRKAVEEGNVDTVRSWLADGGDAFVNETFHEDASYAQDSLLALATKTRANRGSAMSQLLLDFGARPELDFLVNAIVMTTGPRPSMNSSVGRTSPTSSSGRSSPSGARRGTSNYNIVVTHTILRAARPSWP